MKPIKLLLLFVFLLPNLVFAQETIVEEAQQTFEAATPGITPDSPFYILDKAFDTFQPSEDVMAEKLKEIQTQDDPAHTRVAADAYTNALDRFKTNIATSKNPDDLLAKEAILVIHDEFITSEIKPPLNDATAETSGVKDLTAEVTAAEKAIEEHKDTLAEQIAEAENKPLSLVEAELLQKEQQSGITTIKTEIIITNLQEAEAALQRFAAEIQQIQDPEVKNAMQAMYDQAAKHLAEAKAGGSQSWGQYVAGSHQINNLDRRFEKFNDGEVTKEDINQWVQEATDDELKRVVDNERMRREFNEYKNRPEYQNLPPESQQRMEDQVQRTTSLHADFTQTVNKYTAEGLSERDAIAKAMDEFKDKFMQEFEQGKSIGSPPPPEYNIQHQAAAYARSEQRSSETKERAAYEYYQKTGQYPEGYQPTPTPPSMTPEQQTTYEQYQKTGDYPTTYQTSPENTPPPSETQTPPPPESSYASSEPSTSTETAPTTS